jgi:hypothetical protein
MIRTFKILSFVDAHLVHSGFVFVVLLVGGGFERKTRRRGRLCVAAALRLGLRGVEETRGRSRLPKKIEEERAELRALIFTKK